MRFLFAVLTIFCSLLLSEGVAQDRSAQSFVDSLRQGEFPKDIRSGKSLLLLMCDNSISCDNWRQVAEEVQPVLAQSGIDAVATYFFEDILSGVEPFRKFKAEFESRNITHLVIMRMGPTGYTVYLTAFNKTDFIKPDQTAWQTESPELSNVVDNIYRAASNSGEKLRNFLILRQPEYGPMIDIFDARRAEFYDLNFESDKLAVYPFADTAKIRQVMASYPYSYEIIDPSIPEKELRSEGFDFVLYYVHTRAENTKKILGYEPNEKVNSYVSESVVDGKPVINSYSKETPVYKFYIKHVYSGNIFLGKKWDAAPEWEVALQSYISLLRKELLRE
jgi:hypothetical protein